MQMKHILTTSNNIAHDFELLRKHYPIRHELTYPILKIINISKEDKLILEKLGCKFN